MSHAAIGVTADLKGKTARGVFTSVLGQGANFVLRIGSMVVIARLVTPEQFGLVGMVTAFTGMLGLFRDAGLSAATVQKTTISDELISTLFWINIGIGVVLAGLTALAAPLLAKFYGDPRLFWICIGMAGIFVLNGALAQHRALLQRELRFSALAAIDVGALVGSIAIGIGMALAGLGVWALVAMAVALPLINLVGMWVATGWNPGLPQRGVSEIGSMLHYGGVLTLNGLVVYLAYNVDKVLVGRFFGAEVLGVYGRAYQLISIPTENLHTTLGWVMFPALARVRDDPPRLRSYFLKGYDLFLSATMPITVACALFAHDIVRVFLGPQWGQAAPIFQLMAPTILALAMINPMSNLMQASGYVVRSLKLAFLIAPVAITGYVLGMSQGPAGVAFGFSAAMMILVFPFVHWAKKGTLITLQDVVRTVLPPMGSTLVGAIVAESVGMLIGPNPYLRVVVLPAVLFVTHALMLTFVLGKKPLYMDMLRAATGR